MNAVGWFHIQLGDHEEGLVHCQRALDMQKEIPDRLSQAETLDSIACAYRFLARYDEATAYYYQALRLFREFGGVLRSPALVFIGDTRLAAGDPESAGTAWRDAVAILDDLRLPEAVGMRARLSNLASMTGDATEDDGTRMAPAT